MPEALKPLDGFTFGCDPELFLFDINTGEYISPDGLIPGTKEDPFKVPGGAIQQDGMAAEFNIDPASTYNEFDKNIRMVTDYLQASLPKGVVLQALPAVTFSEKVWEGASDVAKMLGCSPDMNAWTGDFNPPPNGDTIPRMRTASGHLHVGWTDDESLADEEHIGHCRDLVKQFDWFLGAWSLMLDPDPTRRKLYGKAGACRYKPYGVEYRVLSNFWVMNPKARLQTWNRMVCAVNDMQKTFFPGSKGLQAAPTLDPTSAFTFNDLLVKSIDSSTRDAILEGQFVYPIRAFR